MFWHIVLVEELFSTFHRLSHVEVMFLRSKPSSASFHLETWTFRFDHENLAFLLDSTLYGSLFEQHFEGTKTEVKQLVKIPIWSSWPEQTPERSKGCNPPWNVEHVI